MRLTILSVVMLAAVVFTRVAFGAECTPVPWSAQESWSNGSQYDPRLDRTVQSWGAGLSLSTVFEGVKTQTGVPIGFFPDGDENARLCVNLYLDPDRPPTLRELMVQLSWTMDCAFGYLGEGEDRSYFLFSTSLGDAVNALLSDEREAELARQWELAGRMRERVPARREELREALSLTHEEAIRRYRDRDNALLFAVLDPTRRALAEFFCALPEAASQTPPGLAVLECSFSQLDQRQRNTLLEATRAPLRQWLARMEAAGLPREAGPDEIAWLESLDPRVSAELNVHPEEVTVQISLMTPHGIVRGVEMELPYLHLVGQLMEEDELELLRLLGEAIPPEDTERALAEIRQEREAAKMLRSMREQLAGGGLSRVVTELLTAARLPMTPRAKLSLWQVQEATARLTGLHIVSDCFYQPERKLGDRLQVLSPDSPTDTALAALQLSTIALESRDMLRRFVLPNPGTVSWEWKSAGRFLVFRSRDRDIWRGAFLDADTGRELEQWAEPFMVGDSSEGLARWPREVKPDWRGLGRIIVGLNSAQMKWGAVLTYGDPTDPRRAYLQGLLTTAMQVAWQNAFGLRFIGGLSESQWQQLQAEGLQVGSDLSRRRAVELLQLRAHEPQPAPLMISSSLRTDDAPGGWAGLEEGDVLQLRSGQGPPYDPGPAQVLVQVRRDGRSEYTMPICHFPDSVSIRPRDTGSLRAPPGE